MALDEVSSSSSSSLSMASSSSVSPSSILDCMISLNVCFFTLSVGFVFKPTDRELIFVRRDIRSSNELSSSPDDPPSINIPFFCGNSSLETSAGRAGMAISWPSLDFERKEDDICDGEKPCTTLPDLMRPPEETLVSEPRCSLRLSLLLLSAVAVD